MIEINPIDVYFYVHTMEHADLVYSKYEHLSKLMDTDFHTTCKRALGGIISKKDFKFYQMLKESGYSFEADFDTIVDQIHKVLAYVLDGCHVKISQDEKFITINDKEFHVSDYVQIFDDQDLLLEFFLLTVFAYRSEETLDTLKVSTVKFKDQNHFNVSEAAEFTGYKKSYIYKLHSEGKIHAGQNAPNGKLTFTRKELTRVMFRYKPFKEEVVV